MRYFFNGLKQKRLRIISSILRESISNDTSVEGKFVAHFLEIRKLVRNFEPNDFCASSYAKSIAELAELQNISERVKNEITRNIEEKLLYCPVLPNYSNALPRMPVVKVMHKFVITPTYMAMIAQNDKGTLDVLYWEEKTRIAQIQETEGMPSNFTKTQSVPLPSMVSKILIKKPCLSNDQKVLDKVLSEYQHMQVDNTVSYIG